MAGQLPAVDERMAKSILTRLAKRTERWKANHPNVDPARLAERQRKWAAGIQERHQLRRAGTPQGKPKPQPKDDIKKGAQRRMSTMPAPRRRRRQIEARRREEGRREE